LSGATRIRSVKAITYLALRPARGGYEQAKASGSLDGLVAAAHDPSARDHRAPRILVTSLSNIG
jgi:hypothetical protein